MSEKKQFEHDCDQCESLGKSADGTCDLYTCTVAGYRTFIARYGNEGHEYQSMPDFLRGGSLHCMEAQSKHIAALSPLSPTT